MIIDLSEPIYLTVLQPVKAWQVHSGFGQTEENVWSCGDAWRDFIQRWEIHARCKLHFPQTNSPYPLKY